VELKVETHTHTLQYRVILDVYRDSSQLHSFNRSSTDKIN